MEAANGTGERHREIVLVAPGEGRTIPLGEAGNVTLKAVGGETGGTLTLYEFVSPPVTAGPPLHLHRSWEETFYVLEGEMTFVIAGQTHIATAGSLVFIPRGVLHTFWNAGSLPAKQLTIFTPAGIEDYFDEATRVMRTGGEDVLEQAIAAMERHDMVVPPDARPAYGALTPSEQPVGLC